MTESTAEKSSTGLDFNLAGALCYFLGFITGVLFLILEKDSKFVRFHAMQSTLVFGSLFVINVFLTVIPLLGWLIAILLFPVTLILWVLLMIKAFQKDKFKLPVVGDIAQKQVQ